MKAKDLCEEIRSFCRGNADDAVVKKYSKYFKEGYDAYGVSREKLDAKVKSLLSNIYPSPLYVTPHNKVFLRLL